MKKLLFLIFPIFLFSCEEEEPLDLTIDTWTLTVTSKHSEQIYLSMRPIDGGGICRYWDDTLDTNESVTYKGLPYYNFSEDIPILNNDHYQVTAVTIHNFAFVWGENVFPTRDIKEIEFEIEDVEGRPIQYIDFKPYDPNTCAKQN